ncbi:unnamed protein product, partial [Prorocentrum cordatum]
EHNERVSNDNSFKDRMSRKEEGVASQRQAIEMATTVAALASSKRKRSRKVAEEGTAGEHRYNAQ